MSGEVCLWQREFKTCCRSKHRKAGSQTGDPMSSFLQWRFPEVPARRPSPSVGLALLLTPRLIWFIYYAILAPGLRVKDRVDSDLWFLFFCIELYPDPFFAGKHLHLAQATAKKKDAGTHLHLAPEMMEGIPTKIEKVLGLPI